MKAFVGRESASRPEGAGSSRYVGLAAGAILLFNALLAVWVILEPVGGEAFATVVNVAEFVGPLLALPLCFGGLLWRRGEDRATRGQRLGPVLLGVGIFGFVLGQMFYTYYERVLQQTPPVPSPADVGFLAQYPFLLLGILLLPARPVPVAARTRIALEGLMVMTAAVTFSWYFILGPVVRQGSETALAKAVAAAYPLADIVLIACLLILAARPGEGALRPAVRLLGAGLVLIVVTDTVFGYQTLNDAYSTGTLLDVGWPLGYMLVALGAYVAQLAPAADETPRAASPFAEQWVWRSLLPYAFVPAVGILAVYAWSAGRDGGYEAGVYAGGGVLIGLVLLRQVLTLVENARLYNRLLEYVRNVERVTAAAAAVEAGEFDPETIAQVAARRDELGRLARVFQQMAREVRARERRLKQEVRQLRIEIDETRTARQVAEITETDYFRDLQEKADRLRLRADDDS